jgi:hypothetical protein
MFLAQLRAGRHAAYAPAVWDRGGTASRVAAGPPFPFSSWRQLHLRSSRSVADELVLAEDAAELPGPVDVVQELGRDCLWRASPLRRGSPSSTPYQV